MSVLIACIANSSESNLGAKLELNAWIANESDSAFCLNITIADASESASLFNPAKDNESESVVNSSNCILAVSESISFLNLATIAKSESVRPPALVFSLIMDTTWSLSNPVLVFSLIMDTIWSESKLLKCDFHPVGVRSSESWYNQTSALP